MPIIASSVAGYVPCPGQAGSQFDEHEPDRPRVGGIDDGASAVTAHVCRHLLGDAFDRWADQVPIAVNGRR